MSYCVNCGVELDASLRECPLCNTPVINPRELERVQTYSPFPTGRGEVERVKRKDLGIFLTVVLAAAGLTCGVLNLLVFTGSRWSLLIMGGCLLLWVQCVPAVIRRGQSVYLSVLSDGAAVAVYLYLITLVTRSDAWLFGLALPITALVTGVGELLVLCMKRLPVSFLTAALYVCTAVGMLCVGLEILIDCYLHGKPELVWSAVVLTVCVILDIAFITMLSRKRLRDAVRRRLHF